jgi:hypothetical protein
MAEDKKRKLGDGERPAGDSGDFSKRNGQIEPTKSVQPPVRTEETSAESEG